MKLILLDMQNLLFADAIGRLLKSENDNNMVFMSESPGKTVDMCFTLNPDVLMMEVAGDSPWSLSERINIRDEVKLRHPSCKIVVVVDENSEKEEADQVKEAKKKGMIDQFVYGSISAAYLAAIIETL